MGNGRSGMADDYENEDKEVDRNRPNQAEKRGSTSNFLSAGGHRYMTNNNAVEVLGGDTWHSLMQKLRLSQQNMAGAQKQRRNGGSGERTSGLIDLELFANIIRSRFERAPIILLERLFQAFCSTSSKGSSVGVEFDCFISTLAVLGSDDASQLSLFLFRVYSQTNDKTSHSSSEQYSSSLAIDREDLEKLLLHAYGEEKLSAQSNYPLLLDHLFTRDDHCVSKISRGKLEECIRAGLRSRGSKDAATNKNKPPKGRNAQIFDLLAGWVAEVLEVFVEPADLTVTYPRLFPLYQQYGLLTPQPHSAEDGPHGVAAPRFRPADTERLQSLFFGRIAEFHSKNRRSQSSGSKSGSKSRSSWGEMSFPMWQDWVCSKNFLSAELAEVIFFLRVKSSFNPVWKFVDFENFCSLFSEAVTENTLTVICHLTVYQHGLLCRGALEFSKLTTAPYTDETSGNLNDSPVRTAPQSLSQIIDEILAACEKMLRGLTGHVHAYTSSSQGIPPAVEQLFQNMGSMLRERFVLGQGNSSVQEQREGEEDEESLRRDAYSTAAQLFTKLLKTVMEGQLRQQRGFLDALPGLRDLSLTACCLFGVYPASPLLEKEYITELTVRYIPLQPTPAGAAIDNRQEQQQQQPFGPPGTKWCIINKDWFDCWRLFVGGKQRLPSINPNSSLAMVSSNALVSGNPPPPSINNHLLLKKRELDRHLATRNGRISALPPRGLPIQLHRAVTLGVNIEAVPPAVYEALAVWYGGGPQIFRTVVSLPAVPVSVSHSKSDKEDSSKAADRVTALIDLFPLQLCIHFCDINGEEIVPEQDALNIRKGAESDAQDLTDEENILVSKWKTVGDVINSLCGAVPDEVSRKSKASKQQLAGVAPSSVRLWIKTSESAPGDKSKSSSTDRYSDEAASRTPPREEYRCLPSHVTLVDANISDGQVLIAEVSRSDGSWPRDELLKLQEQKLLQLEQAKIPQESGAGNYALTTENTAVSAAAPVVPQRVLRGNRGLVGMDNLGNTCYMNSSLQALLHTDLLIDYFLTDSYLRDINDTNKHGYKGRVARSFGKLAIDLWSSNRSCISPKKFYYELAALREQFAGNDQHDAHELLAFLLDGLSEDLNLVHDKPYTEMPDSDGMRSESELADIWWENHLKRDRSVIQALFTGQFKSVTSCKNCDVNNDCATAKCAPTSCGYSSARYEPFNFLTVPIPENVFRLLVVYVIPLQANHSVHCAVRAPKTGTLSDVAKKIEEMNLPGTRPSKKGLKAAGSAGDAIEAHHELFFIAAESVSSRIRSFYAMDRRLDTVKDNDSIVFFQVRRPLQFAKVVPTPTSSAADVPETSMPAAQESNAPNPLKEVDGKQEIPNTDQLPFDPESLFHSSNSFEPQSLVRVAFSQRRIRLVEGKPVGIGGFDFFQLDTFGLPLLEVLPSQISCRDLYKLVESRFKPFLKAPVSSLRRRETAATTKVGRKGRVLGSVAEPSTVGQQAVTGPFSNDEVLGSEVIPEFGFTLRTVSGGSQSAGTYCLYCPWIAKCHGCVISCQQHLNLTLRDGETIAVDWHYVIFEDLLDSYAAAYLHPHKSLSLLGAGDARLTQQDRDGAAGGISPSDSQDSSPNDNSSREINYCRETISINKCLDKFTEEEKLDGDSGLICPRCHSSQHMYKSFKIWRQPPILVVQLKRFQFDRTSRRKLNDPIAFPLDDLDIAAYIAKSRTIYSLGKDGCADPVASKDTSAIGTQHVDAPAELEAGQVGIESLSLGDNHISDCTKYDLYSVIHHVGVMGGGHYVTTIRQGSSPFLSAVQKKQSSGSSSNLLLLAASTMGLVGSTPSEEEQEQDPVRESVSRAQDNKDKDKDKWFCLNDNLVTEVQDPLGEISGAPSAYVLFYIRKDIKALQRSADIASIQQLLMKQLHIVPSSTSNGITASATATATATDNNESNPMMSEIVSSDEVKEANQHSIVAGAAAKPKMSKQEAISKQPTSRGSHAYQAKKPARGRIEVLDREDDDDRFRDDDDEDDDSGGLGSRRVHHQEGGGQCMLS